jgi:hypothetical protein
MNERIYELFDQASGEFCKQNPYATIMLPAPLREKFAELIVQECMRMCKTAVGNRDYNTGRMHCHDNIKEHFGVEE